MICLFCCHLLKFATFFATSWLLLPFCLLAVVAVATINWLMPSCLQLLKLLCNSQWLIIAVFVANQLLLLFVPLLVDCCLFWLPPPVIVTLFCNQLLMWLLWLPHCHQLLMLLLHLPVAWLLLPLLPSNTIALLSSLVDYCLFCHQLLFLFLSSPVISAVFVITNCCCYFCPCQLIVAG